jgi:hypothetical protein
MPNRESLPPVYLQSGDPEREAVSTLHAPGTLGSRFTVIQPTRTPPGPEDGRAKTYQLVQTDSAMTVAPFKGAVAWWSDKTKYLVTTTVTTLGRGRIAGVFQNDESQFPITPGQYTCVQIKGPASVKFVDAPTAAPSAAGLFVIPSATNGKADCLAAGSAATFPPLGVSAGALQGGTALAIVDLDVPETV